MADLIAATAAGTSYAATNYQKFSPTTQMGTRALRVVKVLVSGGTPPNLSTNYASANSDFAKAVRTFETFFETWSIFTPVSTGFIAIISSDTAQDNLSLGQPSGTAVLSSTYADAEAAILAALGSWSSGVVTISEPSITIGTTL